jgi:hypothetical protein
MNRNRMLKTIILATLVGLVISACDSEGEVELTTTSSIITSTTPPDVEATDDGNEGGTTTTLAGQAVSSHEVVLRESTDDGEILYVVIPSGDYTDVDLENFVGNLVENDENISSMEVFDDADAVAVFLLDESEQTAADLVLIDEHHLVTLVDRNRIIFRGPYEEMGEIVIGS